MQRDADDLIGKALGAYTLIEKIGGGGMATVYKAYQASLHRYAAVKLLREDLARNQEFITRFQREAIAIARLSHPNILHVYDAGVAEGLYYIVMDYVDGGSLKDLLERGALSVEQAVSIASQLADALDYAHRHGVIHRDVKPANIMLASDLEQRGAGRPVLSDFGIAKALYEAATLTRTGTAIGTPDYMAPEQFVGGVVDGRADIYSLGVVLYEMVAGQPPFNAPTPMAVLYKQANEPPPPLRQMAPHAPAWLEAVVGRALAKRPEQRYQHAEELAEELQRGVQTSAGSAAYVPPRSPSYAAPYNRPATTTSTYPQPAAGYEQYEQPAPPIAAAGRQAGRSRLVPILVAVLALLFVALIGTVVYIAVVGPGQGKATVGTPVVIGDATGTPGVSATDVLVVNTLETATSVILPTDLPTVAPTVAPAESPWIVLTDTPAVATTAPVATETTASTAAPTAAPPTAVPPTARPTTATEPGVIANFETFGTWKRGDQANGTFTQSSAQAHQGSYSGRLDYQFGTTSNDYVVFQQAHAIGGQPTRLTAWVYGDGSGHFLNAWIKDKAGQVWQVPLGTVSHTGWQQMVGLLDPGQAWPWAHISGPDNGAIDYPISFAALVLDDKPDTYTGSGTIYIDDLRADTASAANSTAPTSAPSGSSTSAPPANPTSAPSGTTSVSGRIAYSAGGKLHVANAQTGQDTVGPMPNMRQPDFQSGGQLIIVNGEGGGQDSLWTARASGGLDREQSTHPDDYYPFFSPSNGSRFVYDSTMMGKGNHNLFVGNLNSRKETRNPLPYGGASPIIGSRPIWLDDDRLVYTGCDYGFGSGANCGLYAVPSWGGQAPRLVLAGGLTVYATDASGVRVLVTTQRDGNWELYIVNADGSGLRNLSNSAGSNDGLGTFSPDGKLVAFVSNRGGGWAIWVIRPDGTGLAKLFGLPTPLTGTWTDERITWGP